WTGRRTSAGCTTNRMGRNNKVPRSWEVFRNANKPKFRRDDRACCRQAFDRVYPRPATPHPWSYLRESGLGSPGPGLSATDADKCRDVVKSVPAWLHNRLESTPRLPPRMSARRTKLDAA